MSFLWKTWDEVLRRPRGSILTLRRLRQWWDVVGVESLDQSTPRPSLWRMLNALRTGQVDRATWRRRIRTCRRCPIYDGELRRCRGPVLYRVEWVCPICDDGKHCKPETEIGDGIYCWRCYHFSPYAPPKREFIAPGISSRPAAMQRKVAVPPTGCGCYVPFLAMTRQPYSSDKGSGCWGRAVVGQGFGWGDQ